MMPMSGKEYGLHEPLGQANDTMRKMNDDDDQPELRNDGGNES